MFQVNFSRIRTGELAIGFLVASSGRGTGTLGSLSHPQHPPTPPPQHHSGDLSFSARYNSAMEGEGGKKKPHFRSLFVEFKSFLQQQ